MDRAALERQDAPDNKADADKSDEKQAAIAKHLADAKSLKWESNGYLYQYLDDSLDP